MPKSLRLKESPETEEIAHHAIVGGTIAVILTAAELLQHGVLEHWSQLHPWAFLFGVLVVALVGSFGLLILFASLFRIRRKIILPGIRRNVNGVWVYKTRDVGSDVWSRVSVAKIEGIGWGFKLSGRSYRREELEGEEPLDDQSSGYFLGEGSLWGNGDRFYFRYEGGERDSEGVYAGDEGVGYLGFFSSSNQLSLRGAFTGSLGANRAMITRMTEGKQVSGAITRKLLRDVLGAPATARGFAGTWVDVIYEEVSEQGTGEGKFAARWHLKQGSIIRITPIEAQARSFRIEGWSYSRKVLATEGVTPDGAAWSTDLDFHGQGRLAEHTHYPVLYYLFGGHESQTGEGVARYELHTDPDGKQTFVGEFTRGQKEAVRIVFGKKVVGEIPVGEELRAYFKACESNPPAEFLAETARL